eukprot:2870560-Prymnesium_polylepis.1
MQMGYAGPGRGGRLIYFSRVGCGHPQREAYCALALSPQLKTRPPLSHLTRTLTFSTRVSTLRSPVDVTAHARPQSPVSPGQAHL